MIRALREFYGVQATPPADLFQFFAWEVLSERALPARRDVAWLALRRIPALTPDAFFRAPKDALLDAVGIAGPQREEKIERVRSIVGEFKRHRDELEPRRLSTGSLLKVRRALEHFCDIPASTRQRALLFALNRPVLAVDDDVNRVVSRLMGNAGIRRHRDARRWLASRVPCDLAAYRDAILYLRHHAQHTCVPVGPRCGVCPLQQQCPSVQRRDPAP